MSATVPYDRVVARLRAGEFPTDLAREYGVSPATISRRARQFGWAGRSFGQVIRSFGRFDPLVGALTRETVVSRIRSGEPFVRIAKDAGVSRARISQIAHHPLTARVSA